MKKWLLALCVVAMPSCGNQAQRAGVSPPAETAVDHPNVMPARDGAIDCSGCGADCLQEEGTCCNLDLTGPCSDRMTEVDECTIVRHCDSLCCAALRGGDEATDGAVWSDSEFSRRMQALEKFGSRRIGPVGGGPVPPGPDVVYARATVKRASPGQLKAMLSSPNAAIRAHAAREIIRHRSGALALVRVVVGDSAEIIVGSMDDVPPIGDSRMSVAELIRGELAHMGIELP